MKRTTCYLMICCLIIVMLCSCKEYPEYAPQYYSKDVWVNEYPFMFFSWYKDKAGEEFFLGIGKYKQKTICFTLGQNHAVIRRSFPEVAMEEDPINKDYSFLWGDIFYNEGFFYYDIIWDKKNFFDGEVQRLKFIQYTRTEFLKEYGNLKYQRELPELKSASYGKTSKTGGKTTRLFLCIAESLKKQRR